MMFINDKNISEEAGQSTIEFLVCFSLVVGMMFLFLKFAINTTNGYLVHYANFMASRAYLVGEINSNEFNAGDTHAFNQAQAVFQSYNIDKFMPNFNGTLRVNHPSSGVNKVFVGTYVNYTDVFSLSSNVGGGTQVNFLSESFLGREPVRSECLARICKAMRDIGADCSKHITFFDNGC